MSEEREREEDPLVDLWLANWEQQCAEHLESQPDCEGQLQAERDRSIHNNWLLFQNTATAIAQLYKGTLYHIRFPIHFEKVFNVLSAFTLRVCGKLAILICYGFVYYFRSAARRFVMDSFSNCRRHRHFSVQRYDYNDLSCIGSHSEIVKVDHCDSCCFGEVKLKYSQCYHDTL